MALSPLKSLSRAVFTLLIPVLWACSTYNQQIGAYYDHVSQGDFLRANAELDKTSLLKKERNKLLYLLEKGRVAHALAQYEASNHFLNLADQEIEKTHSGAADIIAGTLVNPMIQNYQAEDFEKIMMHYYKALNYLYLGDFEEAVVEARRITLQNQQQQDKFNNKDNRYSQDPFSLMLQGMIYESAGDLNNAFIAYRNAAEVYLKKESQVYYGVKLPEQLKKDLLRTAYLNGFTDEQTRFEYIFKSKYIPEKTSEGGDLIVFWENGMAPVKEQEDFFFFLNKGASGFYFVDQQGRNIIPFDAAFRFNDDQFNALHLNVFHVAFPKYLPRFKVYNSALISNGKDSILTERAEDIFELANLTLRQRFAKEMSVALSRMAVKKAAVLVLKGKNNDSKKIKKLREGISGALNIYSIVSEKADTRNWQTLPSCIHYARIPLSKGKNQLTISMRDIYGKEQTRDIVIEGSGKLAFYNYASLQ
jgi:uncharacterized protein